MDTVIKVKSCGTEEKLENLPRNEEEKDKVIEIMREKLLYLKNI